MINLKELKVYVQTIVFEDVEMMNNDPQINLYFTKPIHHDSGLPGNPDGECCREVLDFVPLKNQQLQDPSFYSIHRTDIVCKINVNEQTSIRFVSVLKVHISRVTYIVSRIYI